MFWTWDHLKRVYLAFVVILAVAFAMLWMVQELNGPVWLTPAVCVAAMTAWIVVGAIEAAKQVSENRQKGGSWLRHL
jgi:uncharacterized protein (DUF983 family)